MADQQAEETPSEGSEEDDVEDIQPKKKNIKA